ncbi:MAG: 16S rRNA processing protein RimM [candidate division Zixibacteria bacterium]|nr:16S rRNA processing protein RimM [candidate division Zixibacteria bacterium]
MEKSKETPEYIAVGRFGKTRGVSGEIFVSPLTDFPNRFTKGKTFWIETKDGWEKIKLTAGKQYSNRPAVKLEGISNPEEAKRLTNFFLYIKKEELQELPDGQFYLFDLVDCRVVDDKDNCYGRVIEIEEYPGNDVLVIEAKNGGKYLFPMVREHIKKIDTDGKTIVVDPPDGIFDSSYES